MILPPADINRLIFIINQLIFRTDIYRESDNAEYILICNIHSGTVREVNIEVNIVDCNYRHFQRQKTEETFKKTYRDKNRRKGTQELSIRRREEGSKLESQRVLFCSVFKKGR